MVVKQSTGSGAISKDPLGTRLSLLILDTRILLSTRDVWAP